MSDALQASAEAHRQALRWFEELRDPLRRYLLCAGSSPADADEVMQETFMKLYQQLESGNELLNVRAWVFHVARNYVRDFRRSARHQRTVSLENLPQRNFADPDAGPEQSALRTERTRRLSEAVRNLPKQQRECILLRSAGLRYREIAEILGINANGIGALVQRAMLRLSRELS